MKCGERKGGGSKKLRIHPVRKRGRGCETGVHIVGRRDEGELTWTGPGELGCTRFVSARELRLNLIRPHRVPTPF